MVTFSHLVKQGRYLFPSSSSRIQVQGLANLQSFSGEYSSSAGTTLGRNIEMNMREELRTSNVQFKYN